MIFSAISPFFKLNLFFSDSRKGSRKYHTAYYIQYIEEGKCNFHFPTKAGSSTFFIGKK